MSAALAAQSAILRAQTKQMRFLARRAFLVLIDLQRQRAVGRNISRLHDRAPLVEAMAPGAMAIRVSEGLAVQSFASTAQT
jgi:hypothetical protein